jgi:hypothetical protein
MHKTGSNSRHRQTLMQDTSREGMMLDSRSSTTKIKIALIVDRKICSKYVYELANWGQEQSNLEISHLIVPDVASAPKMPIAEKIGHILRKFRINHLARRVLLHLIWRMESKRLKWDKLYGEHLKEYDIGDIVPNTIPVRPTISQSGSVFRYDDHDIREIRKQQFDILVNCGSGILLGEILNASTLGVIALEHADDRIVRGGPPAFWEVHSKQDTTGFTIKKLSEEPNGEHVLFRGRLATKRSWLLNQAALYTKSNVYFKKVLSGIAETKELPATLESFPYFNRLYKDPDSAALCNYCLSFIRSTIDDSINSEYLRRFDRWGVAFSYCTWRDLVMSKGISIPNPPRHYLADPFVVSRNNENYCFVEDYDLSMSKGCISAYRLFERHAERIGEVIVEPFHMSYPYVFEYQSKYYMCPETCESKQIRLYECEEFPRKWKLSKILMADVSAADTMIFEKDGVWWMFTNIDMANVYDQCSELFIFYADSPLADAWTPHPKNPIFVDSLKARNGGILFDDGAIYRVSQRQGFDRYGKASSINRIRHLSKTDYREETLFVAEANFFEKLVGTHHIHSNQKITVFDFAHKANIDN